MGDRYYLTVTCPKCGNYDDDVYYAPTCGFVEWTCPDCKYVVDLEELTGISYDEASNAGAIEKFAAALQKAHECVDDFAARARTKFPDLIKQESEEMENNLIEWTADYYATKSDEELDVLVAEAAGLTLGSHTGERGWFDKNGAMIHLESEFHPTSKNNFALTLLHELSIDGEGNGMAINTADVMTKTPGILIGGFPFDEKKEVPTLFLEIEDPNSFGEFRKTLLRAICISYILYKNSRKE